MQVKFNKHKIYIHIHIQYIIYYIYIYFTNGFIKKNIYFHFGIGVDMIVDFKIYRFLDL